MAGTGDQQAGWGMVAAGTGLIACCYGLARFAYGLFAPQIQADFDIAATVSGVIGGGSYVGYCLAIVLSLVLTQRLGPRRVAVLSGLVATAGTAVVAVSGSPAVLAAGVLVAGASTGLASPPVAAAVAGWVRDERRDRAQTIANAGTGVGVVFSGPVSLLVTDDWRLAWGAFSVTCGAVTLWVARQLPSGAAGGGAGSAALGAVRTPGAGRLCVAAFLLGTASAAVWTFGQDAVEAGAAGGASLAGLTWTVLGAAGVLGALSGDAVNRLGLGWAWSIGMVLLAGATVLLGSAAHVVMIVLAAAAGFGASYIALSGVLLVWGTRLTPDHPSAGVTLGFLMIAVGQAAAAPVAGAVVDAADLSTAFLACAAVALAGAVLRPGHATT